MTFYSNTFDMGPSFHLEPKVGKYPLHIRGRAIIGVGALPWILAAIAWAIFG